jgi:hypothetical protein
MLFLLFGRIDLHKFVSSLKKFTLTVSQ